VASRVVLSSIELVRRRRVNDMDFNDARQIRDFDGEFGGAH
jgi:hypothetical protein